MWTISLMVAAWVGLGAVTERWAPPGLDGRIAGAAPLRRERYCERGGGDNGGSHGPAAPHIDKAAAAGPALPLDGAARSPRSHWTARAGGPSPIPLFTPPSPSGVSLPSLCGWKAGTVRAELYDSSAHGRAATLGGPSRPFSMLRAGRTHAATNDSGPWAVTRCGDGQ